MNIKTLIERGKAVARDQRTPGALVLGYSGLGIAWALYDAAGIPALFVLFSAGVFLSRPLGTSEDTELHA